MTRKEQLQERRRSLLAELDTVEKELVTTSDDVLNAETDTDADDAQFAAQLRRDEKLGDRSNLI